MKKFRYLFAITFVVVLSAVAFASCAKKKIAVGKYYAENNSESYIEIMEDDYMLFVNIDMSDSQELHDSLNEDINVAEILKSPIPYEILERDYIAAVYHEDYAFVMSYDYKNLTMQFKGEIYTYKAE